MPLVVVVLYAFNEEFDRNVAAAVVHAEMVRDGVAQPARSAVALKNSILVGIFATVIALTLGTLASFAMARARFFGRDAISFALVLPIAFPGS